MRFGRRSTDLLVVQMFLSVLFSQKGSIRLARALIQNPTTRRALVVGGSSTGYAPQRFLSTSKLEATVEEDLDQALSTLLEDNTPKVAGLSDVIPTKEQGARLEKVSLSDLIEETEVSSEHVGDDWIVNT